MNSGENDEIVHSYERDTEMLLSLAALIAVIILRTYTSY
jgi:hypothetical protein